MSRDGAGVVMTRVLGAVTAVYSAAPVFSPRILAKPAGLLTSGDEVPGPVRTLVAAFGARDTAIGAAMVLAKPAGSCRWRWPPEWPPTSRMRRCSA